VERLKIADLAEDLRHDYQANGRRSLRRLEFALRDVLGFFGERRAVHVTAADVNAYVAKRQVASARGSSRGSSSRLSTATCPNISGRP
jgi:hypothetical protein